MFLGTPHKGASLTNIAIMLSYLSYFSGSSTALLENIKVGSVVNDRLHRDFLSFLHTGDRASRVVCVYETVKEKMFGLELHHVSPTMSYMLGR